MGSFQNGPCYKGAVLYWGGLEREPDLENYPYGSPRRSGFFWATLPRTFNLSLTSGKKFARPPWYLGLRGA